jgi:hypothetical protein
MKARFLFIAGILVKCLLLGTLANLAFFAPAREVDLRMASVQEDIVAVRQRLTTTTTTLDSMLNGVAMDASMTTGGDSAAVAVSLQEQTRATLNNLGGRTLSSQVVVTELGGGYRKVSLLLQVELTEQSLLSFLAQTEAARPKVLVESLNVRILPVPADALPLDVTATLTTFYADDAAT